MKRIILTTIAALLCLAPAFAQKTYVSESTPVPQHPRILLLKGEEKALLKQVKKDSIWYDFHNRLIKHADELLPTTPNERIKTGMRLLSISGDNLRKIFLFSYAYRMTGQKKYFTRAEAEMLKAASFCDWNPSHFLDVAEMTMALAIGYDWLYKDLSPQSREIIRKAIVEKGLNESFSGSKSNWWITCDHNWSQVCHGGMTYGALAVWDDDKDLAVKTINRAVECVKIPMEHYAPDGAYPEGVGYWDFGTSFNVLLLSAVEKAFGTDFGLSQAPGFLKTCDFIVNLTSPGMNNFCFSDNGLKPGFHPAMFWFYDKTKDPTILKDQITIYKNNRNGVTNNYLAPAAIIWGSSAPLAEPVLPTKLTYVVDGDNPVFATRSSWTDPNGAFLAFKAGSPTCNHSHLDIGSFMYEYDGVLWAMDMGSENYNSLETKGVDLWNSSQESQRWEVYRYNNLCHNTMTFNLKRQIVKSSSKLDSFEETPNKVTVSSDISSAYAGQVESVRRTVSLLDKRDALIVDQVKCGKKFTMMTWTLVTPAEPKVISDNVLELSKDGKKVYVKVDSPAPIRWRIAPAQSRYTYDNPNPGITIVCFDTDLAVEQSQTYKVLITPVK